MPQKTLQTSRQRHPFQSKNRFISGFKLVIFSLNNPVIYVSYKNQLLAAAKFGSL
jgi:hypothetical protein